MAFRIKIDLDAHLDIQDGIAWYKTQQIGLGRKFHSEIKLSLENLKTNPFNQIRYKGIRCLPVKKYPYMIHYSVDEDKKLITVQAVFNTSRDPKIWER